MEGVCVNAVIELGMQEVGLRVVCGGRVTLDTFNLLIVHGGLAIWGEEVGIFVADVCVVEDDVVTFDEPFDGWVLGRLGSWNGMMMD